MVSVRQVKTDLGGLYKKFKTYFHRLQHNICTITLHIGKKDVIL